VSDAYIVWRVASSVCYLNDVIDMQVVQRYNFGSEADLAYLFIPIDDVLPLVRNDFTTPLPCSIAMTSLLDQVRVLTVVFRMVSVETFGIVLIVLSKVRGILFGTSKLRFPCSNANLRQQSLLVGSPIRSIGLLDSVSVLILVLLGANGTPVVGVDLDGRLVTSTSRTVSHTSIVSHLSGPISSARRRGP
jgi:hypothetical protein